MNQMEARIRLSRIRSTDLTVQCFNSCMKAFDGIGEDLVFAIRE